VVHRDIKPENILLESGHALVADFGIARAVTEAGGERLTGTGISVGTPAYMSPEQASGTEHLDGRSDLYSLGCVLYEVLAGHPPFTGSTAHELLARHATDPVPPLKAARTTIPAPIEDAVFKALEKTPADRYATAQQFSAALTIDATAYRRRQRTLGRLRKLAIGAAGVVAIIGGAVTVARWRGRTSVHPTHPRTAIAVLPFQNLSAAGPHSYFAGGLHDELITQLAKVAALSVRGRTSVMGYAGTTKPIREIANELVVGTILEGSVQVVGDRLRVIAQLIDAATDEHLWAERYDGTLDDAFAIQSDVAQQIVTAVGATLGGKERTEIAKAPTVNAEAYRLYLQGLEYDRRPGYLRQNLEIAQDFYERALVMDSTFALAHAALSEVHGFMSWFRYDPSPARLVRQRDAAATAVRLAPGLAQAHAAMGLVFYFGRRDWQAALKEYLIALDGLPNDAELWVRIGYAHRRLGNWDEVLAAFAKVAALDPRNADALGDLGGNTLHFVRRYRDAVEWYGRSLALTPDVAERDVRRGWTWVTWKGRLDSLAAALGRHPAEAALSNTGTTSAWRALKLYWERRPDSLLGLLQRTPRAVFDGQNSYLPTALYAAWAHHQRGDGAAARIAFDSARTLLDSVVTVLPDDWRVHAALGLALAGLGQRREARREARWLLESTVYRQDAYDLFPAEDRARILAGIGEADAALDEIERLLAGPSWLSVHTLRLDPRWDPIRNDPRFQALLVKYANPQPVR
jgi:TolB-like protein/Flp pilus assembly protein TadD